MPFARVQAMQQVGIIGDDGTDGQAILVDTTGRILAVIQTALPTGDLVIGRVKITNGTDVAQVSAAGELSVNVGNSVTVDGSAVTQPVSAASLPLPTGAATAANQQSDALTDTQLRATAVPVSVATVPSHAVTNAGTFAVQA